MRDNRFFLDLVSMLVLVSIIASIVLIQSFRDMSKKYFPEKPRSEIVVQEPIEEKKEDNLIIKEEDSLEKLECIISGCNNEICGKEEFISICVYFPEFACYKDAVCEVQENGKCGWTETKELLNCLEDKKE